MGHTILKNRLTNTLRIVAMTCGLTLLGVPAASALTVTNEGEETVHVWIENWMYRLRQGKSATFIPTEAPAKILFETRHWRISCEAGADAEVLVTAEKCVVDGVETGDSTFQL